MKRRHFSALAAGAIMGAALPRAALAQVEAPAIATPRDYTAVAPPVAVDAPAGQVDVVEFFSFACPHCFAFERPLQAWLSRQPPQIRFRRSPVPFQRNFRNFQPMWFALEALGLAGTMPRPIFDAVHRDGLRLDTPADIAAFMAGHGVDPDRFMSVFNAPATAARVAQADRLFDASGAASVPTLMVQGRFLTSPWMARGGARALDVVEALAARILAEG
ncbi:MAG: thiol:disulfide interchange protein DsbA/DsbL [Burkholderiales bacterium]|nr:thiol:disulfide interchange protein DsbA/DsbL [Burkholderiales bacterium]